MKHAYTYCHSAAIRHLDGHWLCSEHWQRVRNFVNGFKGES